MTPLSPTPPKPHRRGFRLRGNTLFLLFIFFLIGLFLHYNGQTKPVVAFWNDVKQLLGIKTGPPGSDRADRDGSNPYKAPEPNSDDETTADGRSSDKPKRKRRPSPEGEASATGGTGTPDASQSGNARFDFEKQADFILPAYRPADAIVRHEGYTLRFRDEYKVADWVAYPLLAYELTGDADRKNEPFKPDPDVSTGSAVPADYSRSGYDRGHLAPAADFKFSQRMMGESFYMSNMTPQAPDFNRGIWKELEELVRTWAVRDKGLYIVTGPILKPGLPTIGRKNEVAVPEQFYKILLYCNADASDRPAVRMVGFLLSNEGSERPLTDFVVPVDQIERLSGIDFFPKLPDDIERRLESRVPKSVIADWFQ
ncbi:MAG: DNA/RNA non-specific endonuclease [Bacteroidetes bacterium]|nr:DNA/RNA non-specific endonuclease [Fibrella sp.]